MATMVKEKRPGKKKTKEKHISRSSFPEDEMSSFSLAQKEENSREAQVLENVTENTVEMAISQTSTQDNEIDELNKNSCEEQKTASQTLLEKKTLSTEVCTKDLTINISQTPSEIDSYKSLNARLKRIVIPDQSTQLDVLNMLELENVDAYLQSKQNEVIIESQSSPVITLESVTPSAPIFLQETVPQAPLEELIQDEVYERPRVESMPLEEAIRVYGGAEMAAVREMSEKEEAAVEAGPNCAPDHPLIDLLSTFRSSICAVERERSRLASNFDEEERSRSKLWDVEKKKIHLTEHCKCGLSVYMQATYEHAQLLKEKLPAAKLKLEGLLKDVQESYCHHQHAAMLAHCQIEDLISETIQYHKNGIRDALSLILQALRVSDGAPEALPAALQRWAETLANALIDERDLRQLLFVMHHLFRQTRSVQWAARVLDTRVTDAVTAARTLAVLDTLLSKMQLEAAVECEEETEGAWEEVDVRGGHGAVSAGTLRERDLIALVRALPLQALLAKLLLFSHSDFRQATEYDWGDASGGNGLLKCCCGVRVLLSVLQRAVTTHATYERLHGVLRDVACCALTSLACLYRSPRAPYVKELEEKLVAELHAAFAAGFTLLGRGELHRLPTLLLTDEAARDYCFSFIVGLHDKCSKKIESLCIEVPELSCSARIRMVTRAAVDRLHDHELARLVLDFLLQIAVVRKSVSCKAGCEPTARDCVPELLTAHPHLRATALHTVAELAQVETLEASTVSVLRVDKWRASVDDVGAVLDDWAQRCPALLHQLLLQLDYTPHTGLDLPVQLHIGSWLCTWSRLGPSQLEHAWRVLARLRTHRACWRAVCVAPPPDPSPSDLFSMAHAVLSSEWGHSIPLICSHGVNAIFALCATRPREAVHCLAAVMLLMPQSPESVSLTPKFAEIFTALLSCGPNLVQRALGRGGASGAELLLRLVLSQVDMKHASVLGAWLAALWKVPAALNILDVAAVASRNWYLLDQYADSLLREENFKEHLTNAVRFAATSPLLCECLLRAAHSHEVTSQMFPSLVTALCRQRAASQRIHVDNALQKINPHISSEDLVIYRCASAALVAPFQHPSHLTLWRLFIHMYLDRPPERKDQYWLPCGPLFFSGLVKSRTLSQIKKRLLETAAFHHNEAASFKKETIESSTPPINRVARSESIIIDSYQNLLPSLTITDLTGEPRIEDNSDSDEERFENVAVDRITEEAVEMEKKKSALMAAYHAGAEKMMRDYSRWLEQGEKVNVMPHGADIARYILPQALEEAWKNTLSRCRPPPSPELDTFPSPAPPPSPPNNVQTTPLKTAVDAILSVKCRSPLRSGRSLKTIRPRVEMLDDRAFNNIRLILTRVQELLDDVEKYAEEWDNEVARIAAQDLRLWESVCALRVPRPLPPVKKQCTNKCPPITFYLNANEWCVSAGAERGIKESRSASLAGIRRLSRAGPQVVRTAQTIAGLHNIARRIRSADDAVKVLELAWRSAGRCKPCNTAHAALTALFDTLAERWITHDGKLCSKLLSKGCDHNSSALQRTLCGSLVSPRNMKESDWPDVYITLLKCSMLPPHTIFSFLSRFKMEQWSERAESTQRQAVLTALLAAARRAPQQDEQASTMLLELIGVHTAALTTACELPWLLLSASRDSATGALPAASWRHLIQAADRHATQLTLQTLDNIFHGLESQWCEARRVESARHATYAPSFADLTAVLTRHYVTNALALTYEPARVGECAWSALVTAWSPWVQPASILPDPASSPAYETALERFTDCIRQVMRDCPGSEKRLLQRIYSWVVAMYTQAAGNAGAARGGAGMAGGAGSALLEALSGLPWREHQWFDVGCADSAVRATLFGSEELARWACKQFLATRTESFLNNLPDSTAVGTQLSLYLKLFAGNEYVNDSEFLMEVAKLPWFHLNESALVEGLSYFFKAHYSLEKPYHEMPQAIVILHAAEMQLASEYSPWALTKRARLVSAWTYVYNNPALAPHGPLFAEYMLKHLTCLAPYLSDRQEVSDLLYRLAFMTQCPLTDISPTLQFVWVEWLIEAPAHMIVPMVEMTSALQVLEVTAPIVDIAVRLHLQAFESGWSEIRELWRKQAMHPWLFVEHRALHAAYAATITYTKPTAAKELLGRINTLINNNGIDYIKDEGVIALWLCYMVRVVHDCDAEILKATDATRATASATEATSSTEDMSATPSLSKLEDCKQAALSILDRWGQYQRRSIIKVVTLQADTERPTARHRVLVRFADCILSPSPASTQAFESACAAAGLGDVTPRRATPRALLRLAVKLLPSLPETYFHHEMQHWPEE